MKNRIAFLLCLDSAMLLLVCVLECINFTGLHWHQWLGFAFCPVVLLHVVLQWQWFVTQFQRMLAPGAWRVRVNAGLNLLLLWLMAAVLFSGGFVSSQAVEALGESFAQVTIWSEVHGWLNVALVAAVGLHLGLNWDWLMAALRCLRTATITAAEVSHTTTPPRHVPLPNEWGEGVRRTGEGLTVPNSKSIGARVVRSIGRAVAILLVASLCAGVAYLAFDAAWPAGKRAAMNHQRAEAKAKGLPLNLAPAIGR